MKNWKCYSCITWITREPGEKQHNKHGCAKAETRRCSVRPSLKRIRHLPAQPMKCQKMFINYQDLAVNQLREEALPQSQAVGPIY